MFDPGQYATLSFPQHDRLKGERSFSIASSPADLDQLKFGIRVSGRYTTALRDLRRGDVAMVGGPFGKFTFDPDRDRSAVFIAGGIGITPFLSMIRGVTDLKLANEVTLLYSVRSLNDVPFGKELYDLEVANPNLHVFYAISDGKVSGAKGHVVPGRITDEVVHVALGSSYWGRSYFLCGPPAFMKAMTALLRAGGLPKKAIRTEQFGVGSSAIIESGTPIPKLVLAGWGASAAIVLIGLVGMEQEKREVSAGIERAATVQQDDRTNVNAPVINGAPVVNTPVTPPTTNINTGVTVPRVNTNTSTNSNRTATNSTPPPVKIVQPPVVQPPVVPQPIVQPPAPRPIPVTPRTTVS